MLLVRPSEPPAYRGFAGMDEPLAPAGGPGQTPYKAKRFALKFEPPCIFLEYEDAAQKRRVRAVGAAGAGG
jgi:hypothetical protein